MKIPSSDHVVYTNCFFFVSSANLLQVNLCRKLLFLHQLTHTMITDCPLNHHFSTWKFQAQNMLCSQIVFLFWYSEQFMYTTCSELGIFMYSTGNSMNNLSSYCGLVTERIRASDKDLPVLLLCTWLHYQDRSTEHILTFIVLNIFANHQKAGIKIKEECEACLIFPTICWFNT